MPEAEHVILFHVVLEGACWVSLPKSDVHVRLLAGDVIILPSGEVTVASSARGMRAEEADLAIYRRPSDRPLPLVMKMDDRGVSNCKIVCGFLGCDARPFDPVLEALPQIVHARMSEVSRGWISSLIRVAADETELGSPAAKQCWPDLPSSYSSKCCANISPIARGFARLAGGASRPSCGSRDAADPSSAGARMDH